MPPTFLWFSKFDVKLGVGEHYFQNYPVYLSFQIFGSKLVVLCRPPSQKNELLDPKIEKSPTCCKFEIFDHDPSFFIFLQKKASHLLVKKKGELLCPKNEKSRTCCKLEIFDHDPQLDIKF